MAYSSGDSILDDHYNIFVQGGASAVDHNTANVNTIWGAGTGDKGYGESTALSTVSAGSTITATQWANLLNRCTTLANHQGTSLTSITNPTTGDTISAYTALSTNISTLYANRGSAAANGTDITANGTVTTSSTWDVSATTAKTITFPSANAARYFFNAGGMIRISFSLTGGSDDKSVEWNDLINTQTGVIAITGGTATQTIDGVAYTGTTKVGGSGTPSVLTTTTGWYDLTTSPTEIYKQYADTSPYTSNYITISATQTSSTVLDLTVGLYDAAADTIAPDGTGSGDALDVVDGTLTMTVVVRPPSSTYVTSANWGTPTMSSNTWTLSS
jgi:hypothetical protein